MAIQNINKPSTQWLPVAMGCCLDVYLCLTEEAAAFTVTGDSLIIARVTNGGRFLGSKSSPFSPRFENIRCEDEYQYSIDYDDSQFIVDPQTQLPYRLQCGDIVEIMPYPCSVSAIINISQTPDALCFRSLSEYPDFPPVGQVCLFSLEGHATDPDGLYLITPTQKIQLSAY